MHRSAEWTREEGVERRGLAADAGRARDVGEQRGHSLRWQVGVELVDPGGEARSVGTAAEESGGGRGGLLLGVQGQEVQRGRYADQDRTT